MTDNTEKRSRKRKPRRRVPEDSLIEKTILINRVAKVVKGGRRFSFAALLVVGDGDGKVGIGHGKAKEVPLAVTKARAEAKKAMFSVPRIDGTIPHSVQGREAAGIVHLRPAAPGTGVIAGGPVRAVLESAGISDVLTKSLGSSNTINIVRATVRALKELVEPLDVSARRGMPLDEVAPHYIVNAFTKDTKPVVVADEPASDEVAEAPEQEVEVSKAEVSKEESLKKDAPEKDTQDVSKQETPKKEASKEAPKEDAPEKVATKKETPKKKLTEKVMEKVTKRAPKKDSKEVSDGKA
jgi:small subunit ribosomal protein S5